MPENARLLLLRHGQTTAGEHIFLGSRSDPGLSREGRKQAQVVGQCLSAHDIQAVVVSPLRRARETAELALPSVKARVDGRIREIDFGHFSGLTLGDVQRRYPRELMAWQREGVSPQGGEAVGTVAIRSIATVLDAMTGVPDGGDILFITHNLPIRALLASARGMSRSEWARVRLPHGALRSIHLTPMVLARWQAILKREGRQGGASSGAPSISLSSMT